MRDILILAITVPSLIYALRHPWVGIMLWLWLSLMNPHRYAYGIAFDAPLAALSAIATMIGLFATRDPIGSPFKGPPVKTLAVFMAWMTLSLLVGLDPQGDLPQWQKVMKIDFMILVGLAVLSTKKHMIAMAWVLAMSLAILGVKGGIFTLMTGGSSRVWGPPGTFVEDNNEFALALIMVIPLLRFLQLQLASPRGRQLMTVVMLLCALSALGSQSRGALLALSAMSMLMWWRGRSRVVGGVLMLVIGVSLVLFMPDQWSERMGTMKTYEDDGSAMGRISAWWTAWNLAFHYPAGVGFNAVRPELFALYSPYSVHIQAAHSIYFQILGHHGFIGLGIYLVMWVQTWRMATWLRKNGPKQPETAWCAELGAMAQVSLIGYFVGGAFLSLAYFDLPYCVISLVVLARTWMLRRSWEREAAPRPSRFSIPGLAPRRVGKPT